MKRKYTIAGVALWVLFFLCADGHCQRNTITQISTIDALLAGVYDGQMPCSRLMTHGTLGIGTFDHLDGEMVLLDGKLYQVKADGKVYEPPTELTTPFASVCHFMPDKGININDRLNYVALKELLDEQFSNQNLFCAIKITGRFKSVLTRSVPAQKKPYPPLVRVTARQPEFSRKNINGTIVGFRCPPFVKGINVPGYHLHFLSDDKTFGGHLLTFEMEKGQCAVDLCNRFVLILPENENTLKSVDLSKDRSKALKQVEQKD